MTETSPQLLYILLVLPSLFGLALLGDGINKIVHEENSGIFNIVFGFLFLGVVIFAHFFFKNM